MDWKTDDTPRVKPGEEPNVIRKGKERVSSVGGERGDGVASSSAQRGGNGRGKSNSGGSAGGSAKKKRKSGGTA